MPGLTIENAAICNLQEASQMIHLLHVSKIQRWVRNAEFTLRILWSYTGHT